MESITYEIDPGGNIELVLNKPNDQNIIPCLQLSTDTLDTDPHDTRFENPSCRGRYAVFENLYATTETLTNTEVRFRVSSRHLILASHFFRAMLEGPWMEGTSSSQPLRQINATGWDAMAFAIVLDAIHGRHREIPYELTLGLVTRIATVIDYYGCHEAMYVYFDKWLNQNSLVNTSLSVLRKETLLCLYVSWVFSADATFILLARLVFRHSEGLSRIDTSDVPLGGILEQIDNQRQEFISYLFQSLDAVQTTLLNETECPASHDSGCVSRTLGGLMRARHKLVSHHDRPPEHPYDGYSIAAVLKMIETIEKPTSAASVCTVAGRMDAVVKHIEKHIVYLAGEENRP